MVIMQFEIVPLFSFLLKSVSRKELSIDLRASIEGQYSSARLEPAFLTWWHGTGIELVYFELVSLSEQKYTAYEHFQETGSYGTKKKTDQVWTTKPLTHVFPWFLLHLNNKSVECITFRYKIGGEVSSF